MKKGGEGVNLVLLFCHMVLKDMVFVGMQSQIRRGEIARNSRQSNLLFLRGEREKKWDGCKLW